MQLLEEEVTPKSESPCKTDSMLSRALSTLDFGHRVTENADDNDDERADMTEPKAAPVLRPPDKKIERALEIRKSTAKAREGKAVAFPNRRSRRTRP